MPVPYLQTLHRLLALADYERMTAGHAGPARYDLRRMRALLRRLGNPERSRATIHVAGTKGKGSVSALCTHALVAQGFRVGTYTSPHLHSFTERIRWGGAPVSEAEFVSAAETVWPGVEALRDGYHEPGEEPQGPPTVFEVLTAMAFAFFRENQADIQVLEVGLGGRLDATNVVPVPEVAAITALSMDHAAVLGNTLEAIAFEKAGIIKRGGVVVSAPQRPEAMAVLRRACAERGARLVATDSTRARRVESTLEGQTVAVSGPEGERTMWLPLLGTHQVENAVVALAALDELRRHPAMTKMPLDDVSVVRGFARVWWPCRLEVLRDGRRGGPLVVADGAHNPASAEMLRVSVAEYLPHRPVTVVAGISGDKDIGGIVRELAAMGPARVVTGRSRHPRAVRPDALAEAFRAAGCGDVATAGTVGEALRTAIDRSSRGDLILVTGSLFAAAEAREALLGIAPEVYPEFLPGMPPAP